MSLSQVTPLLLPALQPSTTSRTFTDRRARSACARGMLRARTDFRALSRRARGVNLWPPYLLWEFVLGGSGSDGNDCFLSM